MSILERKQQVDFQTIPLSSFNFKWRKFACRQLPTFPNMVIQRKENHLGQCQASSRKSGVLFAGTYVFRNLLQVSESVNFDFHIQARGISDYS